MEWFYGKEYYKKLTSKVSNRDFWRFEEWIEEYAPENGSDFMIWLNS